MSFQIILDVLFYDYMYASIIYLISFQKQTSRNI